MYHWSKLKVCALRNVEIIDLLKFYMPHARLTISAMYIQVILPYFTIISFLHLQLPHN